MPFGVLVAIRLELMLLMPRGGLRWLPLLIALMMLLLLTKLWLLLPLLN